MDDFTFENGLCSMRTRSVYDRMVEEFGQKYIDYRNEWGIKPPRRNIGPLHLDIDLRDACNQSCIMCHQSYRKRTNTLITHAILEKALREGAEIGLCSINIGASSEPFLEKRLVFDALALAAKYGIMDTFLHTNGLLLTEDLCLRLIDSGIKHVCISFDAATPETYKAVRRSGDFAALTDNVNRLIELRRENAFPEVRVSFCVLPNNKHEMNAFVNQWQNIADLTEFQEYHFVSGSAGASLAIDDGLSPICTEGLKRGMLWPNGDITPCCFGWDGIQFGNIVNQSFRAIWNSPESENIRTALRNNRDIPPVCKLCKNRL